MQKTILLVDDDAFLMQALAELLRGEGYTVFEANGVKKALRLCEQSLPDLVIADYRMPGLHGVHLLDTHRKLYPDTPIVMMSAFGTLAVTDECLSRGAADFLVKPFATEKLLGLARRLTGTVAIAVAVEPLLTEELITPLVGHAACMRRLFREIAQQRYQHQPLCILGEKGTGKRQVALAIHDTQHVEADIDTVKEINLNNITIENVAKKSHLRMLGCMDLVACFDAYQQSVDAAAAQILLDMLAPIQQPNQGNQPNAVFIYGLSDLSYEHFLCVCPLLERCAEIMQTHSLRLFISVGISDTSVSVLARDWVARLAWENITVPALRQRSNDLALLIAHFLQRCSKDLNKALQLTQTVYEQLLAYPWPGNVGELQQRLYRAALQTKDGVISENELELPVVTVAADRWEEILEQELCHLFMQYDGAVYEQWMQKWEVMLLRFAAKRCKGNKFKMAESLGLHRTTLRKKLRGVHIL